MAEVITALTVTAMILVAVLAIYSRAESSASAITRKMDKARLPLEVLQRIAEDIDHIISPGADTKITIENKIQEGYPAAKMIILKTIYDKDNQLQTFEKIVWQSSYDYESNAAGLVLYRSHSGLAPEDKLLDEQKELWERQLFVPIAAGITFFRILVPVGDDLQDRWTNDPLPQAIAVTISFAEPSKTSSGIFDVPETEKIRRTIAVDRIRKIKFAVTEK